MEKLTIDEVRRYSEELRTWNRWGEDDEIGTLNFVTPVVRGRSLHASAPSRGKRGTGRRGPSGRAAPLFVRREGHGPHRGADLV
jgi:hypothetical protein